MRNHGALLPAGAMGLALQLAGTGGAFDEAGVRHGSIPV